MELIEKKLNEALRPLSLKLRDDSHLHEGHSGHIPGVMTHLAVEIVSDVFEGKSRLQRHRLVLGLLKDFLDQDLYAVTKLKTHTADEYAALKA